MAKHWLWDLETGPLLPHSRTIEMAGKPFVPPAYPGEFDPSTVKTGNLKDPAKIAEKIESARLAHMDKLATYITDYQAAESAHAESILARAALSSITGQVLLGGFRCYETGDVELFYRPSASDEPSGGDGPVIEAIANFISRLGNRDRLIGWNTHSYDCPFLMRRAMRLGASSAITSTFRLRFYAPRPWGSKWVNATENNIDLMKEWQLGDRHTSSDGESKLDSVARHFGHTGKSFDGANFWRLWESDRRAAISGNLNDLDMLRLVAERMEVLEGCNV